MELRLQPEKEAQLAQIAAQKGLDPDELARQVLSRYLEDDKRFTEAVNIGLTAAERGDFVEHEEVRSRLRAQLEGGLGTEIAAMFPKHGPDFALESPFDLPRKAAGLRPADRGRLSPRKSSRSRRKKRT